MKIIVFKFTTLPRFTDIQFGVPIFTNEYLCILKIRTFVSLTHLSYASNLKV